MATWPSTQWQLGSINSPSCYKGPVISVPIPLNGALMLCRYVRLSPVFWDMLHRCQIVFTTAWCCTTCVTSISLSNLIQDIADTLVSFWRSFMDAPNTSLTLLSRRITWAVLDHLGHIQWCTSTTSFTTRKYWDKWLVDGIAVTVALPFQALSCLHIL